MTWFDCDAKPRQLQREGPTLLCSNVALKIFKGACWLGVSLDCWVVIDLVAAPQRDPKTKFRLYRIADCGVQGEFETLSWAGRSSLTHTMQIIPLPTAPSVWAWCYTPVLIVHSVHSFRTWPLNQSAIKQRTEPATPAAASCSRLALLKHCLAAAILLQHCLAAGIPRSSWYPDFHTSTAR